MEPKVINSTVSKQIQNDAALTPLNFNCVLGANFSCHWFDKAAKHEAGKFEDAVLSVVQQIPI